MRKRLLFRALLLLFMLAAFPSGAQESQDPVSMLVEAGYVLARDPDTVRGPDVSYVAIGGPERAAELRAGKALETQSIRSRSAPEHPKDSSGPGKHFAAGPTELQVVASPAEIVRCPMTGGSTRCRCSPRARHRLVRPARPEVVPRRVAVPVRVRVYARPIARPPHVRHLSAGW